MTPLERSIEALRAEAAAQRIKAAELRRRATWWRPLTRVLMRMDADALEDGAAALERAAERWACVLPGLPAHVLTLEPGPDGLFNFATLSDAIDLEVERLLSKG